MIFLFIWYILVYKVGIFCSYTLLVCTHPNTNVSLVVDFPHKRVKSGGAINNTRRYCQLLGSRTFLLPRQRLGSPHLRQVLRVSGSRAATAARTKVFRSEHGSR